MSAVYASLAAWKNPDTGETRQIFVAGFDPSKSVFEMPGVKANSRAIRFPDAVLYDEAARPEFGPIAAEFKQGRRIETEVSNRASSDATAELARAIPDYSGGGSGLGARAGYRGQIGRRGALPHSLGANVTLQPGDTLVTGATAPMWGYVSELERTMFVGPPGAEQERLFGARLTPRSSRSIRTAG